VAVAAFNPPGGLAELATALPGVVEVPCPEFAGFSVGAFDGDPAELAAADAPVGFVALAPLVDGA